MLTAISMSAIATNGVVPGDYFFTYFTYFVILLCTDLCLHLVFKAK